MLFTSVKRSGASSAVARFYFPHSGAHNVSVTGSFCGWQSPGIPLSRREGAHGERGFYAEVPLDEMPREGGLQYKFIADGRWVVDPINLARTPDGAGGFNSILSGPTKGSIHHLSFHAPSLAGEPRGYVVYLPPGYAYGDQEQRVPTLYLLHGALDWERTWAEKGELAETMDALWQSGAIGDLIVIMPRESGDLCRGDGRVIDYLTRDLIGHIEYEFRVDPSRRAIDGLSTGGFTSLYLGAMQADKWRSVGSMSGSYDKVSFELVDRAAAREPKRQYLLSCGSQEPCYDLCRSMFSALASKGVSPSWGEVEGGHDWSVWRALLATHLRFHWSALNDRR